MSSDEEVAKHSVYSRNTESCVSVRVKNVRKKNVGGQSGKVSWGLNVKDMES